MSHVMLARAAQALARRKDVDPLKYFRPTPIQRAWLGDNGQAKLLRGPNQAGKTVCQVVECIWRATGTHPYLNTHRPPIQAWIICHSWEQSVAVQAKFYEMVPKDTLHPDTSYSPGRGFRGVVPVVRFKNGSIVRFKTTHQGSLGLASATVHYVGIDEPPPPEIWSELAARVLRHRGVIGLTLTPIGRPVGWLRDLVQTGSVSDHRFSLTVENCTPSGGKPFITQEQIDDISRRYLPIEIPQRLHGEWEGIVSGRIFSAFGDDHIIEAFPRSEALVAIGIDHGSVEGSQVAVLVCVDKTTTDPKVWVLDEYVSDGATTSEQDAQSIIAMLRRNNMTHANVDHWVGDRRHGGRRWGGAKSNRLLMDAFGRALGLPVGRLPFHIRGAHKPQGSVYVGVRQLHETMIRKNFSVHPRCKNVIRSLMSWQGADDEHKHAIDALRYGAVELLTRNLYMPSHVAIY